MRKQSVGGFGAMFTSIKDKLSHNTMDPMMEMLDEGTAQISSAAHNSAATATTLIGAEPEGRLQEPTESENAGPWLAYYQLGDPNN